MGKYKSTDPKRYFSFIYKILIELYSSIVRNFSDRVHINFFYSTTNRLQRDCVNNENFENGSFGFINPITVRQRKTKIKFEKKSAQFHLQLGSQHINKNAKLNEQQ